MKIQYDPEADALYIQLKELVPGTAECRELSDDVVANYGPDGRIAGIEVLEASVTLGNKEMDSLNVEFLRGAMLSEKPSASMVSSPNS